MKRGDYVTRKSYGGDILFTIVEIYGDMAFIRGTEFRLLADAPINDLQLWDHSMRKEKDVVTDEQVKQIEVNILESRGQYHKKLNEQYREVTNSELQNTYFDVPGKVLHLDGDEKYLNKSLELYHKLKVPVKGYFIQERNMASALEELLPKIHPDIVVITGHDGMIKGKKNKMELSNYKNSTSFVRATQVARSFERNRDVLTIIAGACQSHFEALLKAGANFASSPGRILIHALDPVQIACKTSYTSIQESVNMVDVISYTISGLKGIGGIETRGNYRIGLPNLNDTSQ
ncbi:sporulation peptidase YabG [Longirhabdus pacifica]|uniref:sporulation peptidase YabG n=1 Tax=Longirhabdus pacifica TaxID=2305227 RepID=UPI001008D9E1|nr:sporulation peptidase YabG [Longirhabdus pacifica]